MENDGQRTTENGEQKTIRWDEYVNEALTRFSGLWQSDAPMPQPRNYKRAWRFILTGDESASKVDERITLLKALLSSPEMLAIVVVLITALGSMFLYVLEIPLVVTDPEGNMEHNPLVAFLHATLRPEGPALRFVLVSTLVFFLMSVLIGAIARIERDGIERAKAPLLVAVPSDVKEYLSDAERDDSQWYQYVALFMSPFLITINILASPLALLLFIVLSAWCSSLMDGNRGVLVGFLSAIVAAIGWCHYWAHLAPPTANNDQISDGENNGTRAGFNRCRKWLCDLHGLKLVIVSVLLEGIAVWLLSKYRPSLASLDTSLSVIIMTFVYVMLIAYAVYQLIWILAACRHVAGVVLQLKVAKVMRNGGSATLNSFYYKGLSFSGWCKLKFWGACASAVFSALLVGSVLFLLCFLDTYSQPFNLCSCHTDCVCYVDSQACCSSPQCDCNSCSCHSDCDCAVDTSTCRACPQSLQCTT